MLPAKRPQEISISTGHFEYWQHAMFHTTPAGNSTATFLSGRTKTTHKELTADRIKNEPARCISLKTEAGRKLNTCMWHVVTERRKDRYCHEANAALRIIEKTAYGRNFALPSAI